MECLCRQCRRLFRPTTEGLNSGSPHWWYCPACQNGQHQPEAQQAMRPEPTLAQARAPRRRLRQGCDPEREAADPDDLERVLAEVWTIIGRRKRGLAP